MNIAVIGATGMVGERTVAEAVARGHQVDAYSRSGNAVPGAESKIVDLANTTLPLLLFLPVAVLLQIRLSTLIRR